MSLKSLKIKLALILMAGVMAGTLVVAAPQAKSPVRTPQTAQSAPVSQFYAPVSANAVVKNPSLYMNKYVKIKATFNKFSTLGLDYKPVMRSSQDYISFLILNDELPGVPLSEMKIFIKRTEAEKFIDLDSGDKIEFDAKVIGTALGDPWLEVQKLTVTQKKPKDKDKAKQ